MRGDRGSATWSAQREKVAQRSPMVGRRRGGGSRFAMANDAEGSQTGASQIVDLTQYQQQYQQEVY